MMALAAIAILVPSIFAVTGEGDLVARSVAFSVVVSVILLAVYVLSLIFTLRTHADLFRGGERRGTGSTARRGRSPWRSASWRSSRC